MSKKIIVLVACLLFVFLFESKVWARKDVVEDTRTKLDEARVQQEKEAADAEAKRDAKWWNIRFSTALQYDDNIIFRPDDDRAVTDFQDKEDVSWVNTLSVKLTPLRKEHWKAGFRYALYDSVNGHAQEYDLLGNTFSAFVTYQSEKLIIHTQYNFTYFDLDKKGYLRLHDVSPTFVWIQRENLLGIYKPVYRNLDYIDNSIRRDGRDWGISAEEWFLFGSSKQYRISVGYGYTDEDVKDDAYSYKSNEFRAGFHSPLWWQLELDVSLAYQTYNYIDINPVYNADRDDNRWVYSFGLSRKFGKEKNMIVELLFTHTTNNSTIGAEEYHRNVGSLSFAVEW